MFETVLYAEDLAAAERFYHEALGLEVMKRVDLVAAFRCGGRVLLIFDPRKSGAPGRDVPFHGTSGVGHVAFAAKPEDLEAWRKQLRQAGSRSNERLTGPTVGVRSIFVTQRGMWLSWLHQPFGLAVGSLDPDDVA